MSSEISNLRDLLCDLDEPRLNAALAEIQRQRRLAAQHYPQWVASSKLTQEEADDRLTAVADAELAISALIAALHLANATGPMHIGRPLPYDKDLTIATDEPEPSSALPRCRFCNGPLLEQLCQTTKSTTYRCNVATCQGSRHWVALRLIEAPPALPALTPKGVLA
jgi:hypothetical protein